MVSWRTPPVVKQVILDHPPTRTEESQNGPPLRGDQNALRFAFTARHTKFHSPRTFASPRRPKHRKPSTCLTQPYGGADNHVGSAYGARPAGVDSFFTIAGRAFRLRSATLSASRAVATYRSTPRVWSSVKSRSLQNARRPVP